ncbi:hypothetical protein L249_5906 [Ophiocordyceps polyrhachis-furcata BCC 54312]|uniref:Uncharacterized protein n=1 Tax=Ophiocordyceps polyrhachis-furcata BCC 54312 TaxID=1330021 RepID=A0A367L0B9_9HYPO|nr:hypothetical protein L249_5906 [Ophiocordyceps polyrhachis-furcata BCC 54312]
MLTRRLIVLLKKARLACPILKRPLYGVAASYVVVLFLPLLCNVRRPRAGYGRPGVTVSSAPAKLVC